MAETTTVTVADVELFKRKALHWANHFAVVCLLDSNAYTEDKYHTKDWVLAVDAADEITSGEKALPVVDVLSNHTMGNAPPFEQLHAFQQKCNTDIFGFFSYDLKNKIEKLSSRHTAKFDFPELYFFKPRYILQFKNGKLTVNRNYPETFELIELIQRLPLKHTVANPLQLRAGTTKEDYRKNVEQIKLQIASGDYYELNYCNEFYGEGVTINPLDVFFRLNEKARAPFSTFFKLHHNYLLCASPERFLKKEGSQIISQPIKGTIRKGVTEAENEQLKQQLKADEKERAENVMIVDLVRNDLARSAKPGTVQVEELFGIYEFAAVNQMISTVTAELEGGDDIAAIKHAFPMGSMTGAPKIEVMKNIDRYENFRRGLFSGSVGYITANGNFDFNVVIRSIIYNATSNYVSVPVGGAITFDSDAESEYREMRLKAEGMLQALNATITEE
ncbi:MAG: anthranilate synthase component I family protein [Chitinophagales bacterium]|nr:anthranilate synthase component I family protein [Chitinophagales bacterium]